MGYLFNRSLAGKEIPGFHEQGERHIFQDPGNPPCGQFIAVVIGNKKIRFHLPLSLFIIDHFNILKAFFKPRADEIQRLILATDLHKTFHRQKSHLSVVVCGRQDRPPAGGLDKGEGLE